MSYPENLFQNGSSHDSYIAARRCSLSPGYFFDLKIAQEMYPIEDKDIEESMGELVTRAEAGKINWGNKKPNY